MIVNYLKIAWRNMIKNKTFSLINITGLSIGISVCFIIMMYVQNELSYDRYNKNADRIARIQFKATMNGGQIDEASVMAPVAQAVKNDFPEVEEATRLLNLGGQKVNYGTKTFKNDVIALADPNFFNVFTLPLIHGDVKTVLSQPGTLIISKATAEKYFGSENPIGKTIGFDNNTELYKVTGVFDKIPDNSHFHFDMLGTMVGFKRAQSPSWMEGNFFTYLLLRPGSSQAALQAKFPAMVQKYMGPQIQQAMGISLEQFRTKGNQLGFILQPLTAIHLHPNATNELEPAGNASYVYIFGAIAIFMLLVACINFINLATAGASKRAKEIGVRKVIGSDRSQLIAQFLIESALLVLTALGIAFLLIIVFLPVFNEISGKTLAFSFNFTVIAAFFALGLIVVVAAGIYPAFFLSSFKPISVLKGKMTGNKSFGLRSGLVVFQFFISVSLIVGTIVVYEQMRYIQNKDLGYNKEQIVTIPNSYLLGKNEKVFKDLMLHDPRVVNGTLSWYKPAGPTNNNNALVFPDGHDNTAMKTENFHVDEQYIPTFGIKMAAGRNFSAAVTTDSSAMIINEAAVKALGFTATNAIGQTVAQVNSGKGKNFKYHVIGVVKDFNFKSLHEAITPMLLTLEPEGGVIFKIHTTDVAAVLTAMKKQWDTFNTGEPFTYTFLDDLYNKTYAAEQKTSAILDVFALLTVIVACLGLFGLVTYTAEQRVKEIGIRKVLGASVAEITRMLSADFLRLVLIACLVAFPASRWATNQWLQSFAYRMTIHWWIFAIAAACALLIALITLSFQAIKAAIANPIKSLRTE
ncbi:MAG TPA: ABC transporter permease [Mucilaginibacter sp.]|jgi:putative ABC transport system permease protein